MTHNRNKYLEKLVKDKTVLHCGASEGSDTRAMNRQKNNWLHSRLKAVAKKVVGVDIDPIEDIKYCNLSDAMSCSDIMYVAGNKFDYIILGEVIEHLTNPGIVLGNLKMFEGELVITTPNVFSIRKFVSALFGKEVVSKTHTCYYSFKTLNHLLNQYGYKVTRQETYSYLGKFGFIQQIFYKLFPLLTDGIIIHAKRI